MEVSHEQVVECDIACAGHCDENHWACRIAETSEDGADDVVGDDERDAGEADQQVLRGTFDCFGRCSDQDYDAVGAGQQDYGEYDCDSREKGDGVADGACRIVEAVRADRPADGHG